MMVPQNLAHRRQQWAETTARKLMRKNCYNVFLCLFILFFCVDYGHARPLWQLFDTQPTYTEPRIMTKRKRAVQNSAFGNGGWFGSTKSATANRGSDYNSKDGLLTFQPIVERRHSNSTPTQTQRSSLCFVRRLCDGRYIDHSDVLNPIIHDGPTVIDGVILHHVQSYRNGWLLFCPRGQPIMFPGFEAEADHSTQRCRPYHMVSALHTNYTEKIEGVDWVNTVPIVWNGSFTTLPINDSWTATKIPANTLLASPKTPPYANITALKSILGNGNTSRTFGALSNINIMNNSGVYGLSTINASFTASAKLFSNGSANSEPKLGDSSLVQFNITGDVSPNIPLLLYKTSQNTSVAMTQSFFRTNSTRSAKATLSYFVANPSSRPNMTSQVEGRERPPAVTPLPSFPTKDTSVSANWTFASNGWEVGLFGWKSSQTSSSTMVEDFPRTNLTATMNSYASVTTHVTTMVTAMPDYSGPIYSMESPSSSSIIITTPPNSPNVSRPSSGIEGPDTRRTMKHLFEILPPVAFAIIMASIIMLSWHASKLDLQNSFKGLGGPFDSTVGQGLYKFKYTTEGDRLEQFLNMVERTKTNGVNVQVTPLLPDEEVVILPGGSLEVQPGANVELPKEAVVRLAQSTVLLAAADGVLYLCKAMICEPEEEGANGIPFKKGVPTRIPVNERPGEVEEFREIKIRSYGLLREPVRGVDDYNVRANAKLESDVRVRFQDGTIGPHPSIKPPRFNIRFPGNKGKEPDAWKGRYWTTPKPMSDVRFRQSVPPGLWPYAGMYQGMVRNPDPAMMVALHGKIVPWNDHKIKTEMLEAGGLQDRPYFRDGRVYALISDQPIACKFVNGQFILDPDYDDSYGPTRISSFYRWYGDHNPQAKYDYLGTKLRNWYPRPSPPPKSVPVNRPPTLLRPHLAAINRKLYIDKPPWKVYRPPVRQPPTRQPPIRQPPIRQPPVRQPPVRQPPVNQPPTSQPPPNNPECLDSTRLAPPSNPDFPERICLAGSTLPAPGPSLNPSGPSQPTIKKLPGPDKHNLWPDSWQMNTLYRDPYVDYHDPYPAQAYRVSLPQSNTQPPIGTPSDDYDDLYDATPSKGNSPAPSSEEEFYDANDQSQGVDNDDDLYDATPRQGKSPASSSEDEPPNPDEQPSNVALMSGALLDGKPVPMKDFDDLVYGDEAMGNALPPDFADYFGSGGSADPGSAGPGHMKRAENSPTHTSNLMRRRACPHPWLFWPFTALGVIDCLTELMDESKIPPGTVSSVVNPVIIQYYKDHSMTLPEPASTPTPTPAPTYDNNAPAPSVLHVPPEVAEHYQYTYPDSYAPPADLPIPTSFPDDHVIRFERWNNTADKSVIPDLPDRLTQPPETVTEFFSQYDNWSHQAQLKQDACKNNTACLDKLHQQWNDNMWNVTAAQKAEREAAREAYVAVIDAEIDACSANITCIEELAAPIVTRSTPASKIKQALSEQDAMIEKYWAERNGTYANPAGEDADYKPAQEMIDKATEVNAYKAPPLPSKHVVHNEAVVDPLAASVVHLNKPGAAEAVGSVAETLMLGILGGFGGGRGHGHGHENGHRRRGDMLRG
ncbi:MAG: hypothetical protein MMC33_003511 [Icmadophila ericetorum]|nr:hypothetical protein [Icmadophila ericetorum]